MSLNSQTDTALIGLYCKTANKQAFGILYQRYVTMVMSVCLKYVKNQALAEDLTQQVFEKLMNVVCKHDITYFKSWLYQTTRNHCLMYLRKKKPESYDSDFIESVQPLSQIDDGVRDKENIEKNYLLLERAIEELNSDQRTCLRLFYMENMSYAQIGQTTGMSFGEIKSHLQNAKRNLKNALNS